MGKFGWIKHLIDISIDGVSDLNRKQVKFVINELSKRRKEYHNECGGNNYIHLDIEIDSKHR